MSYNSNNYHTLSSVSRATTYAIAEVPTKTLSTMRYSCGTRFKNFTSFYTWTVTGLTALPAGTTSVESIPFTHQSPSEWCMVLTKQPDGLYLSFLLKKCETDKPLKANVKALEILPTGEKREALKKCFLLTRGVKSEQVLIRGIGASHNEDGIILECEICIQCIIQDSLPAAEEKEPHIGIVTGLDEMFDKEVLTDFDLHAGGTVLKAHRALLSVRSQYFASMLQPHTMESKEGLVEVTDVKPEVLKQVLLYMYTGVAPALKDMPWDLLIAADKYELHQLKSQCEEHIAGCLNVDNAAETAVNAKVFSCKVLWERAVVYIKQNLCEVMDTSGWNEIITTHPETVQCISKLMK